MDSCLRRNDKREGHRDVMRVVIIDNDDSFTGNLEHLLVESIGSRPLIVPYSHLDSVNPEDCDLAVISAGPGKPSEYPDYAAVLESDVPLLGICLGMQIINEHFGGETARLPDCVHGKTDRVEFDGHTFTVARYHSLCLQRVADCLEVIAVNAGGVPMALRHKTRRIIGYQFHPESFMTPEGAHFVDYAISFLYPNRSLEVPGDRGDARKALRR
jgi:anthranilate/para-aminobenzoate synthase component II